MMSLEDALAQIHKSVPKLADEVVSISDAAGRVLAEEIVAAEDVPAFPRSAMDGFAVRAADVASASAAAPVKLRLRGTVSAGSTAAGTVEPGTAVRVLTGAMIPSGADAVVMQEDCEAAGDAVSVKARADAGAHVDPQGNDVKEGESVLKPGELLRPRHLALLASLGYAEVRVSRRPRVAVLATGSELVEVDDTPEPGKIRNSNSYSLQGLVQAAGCEAALLGIADDDKEDLSDKMDLARDYDMLLVSAGMSVGDKDLVKDVLKEMGFELGFWQVAVKPGKPVLFGKMKDLVVFGLPGNPVSSMVTFDLFVRPALARMQGRRDGGLRMVWGELSEPFQQQPGRRCYARGILDSSNGKNSVKLAGPQGSSNTRSMARANCLVVVPEDVSELKAGTAVRVALLDGDE